MQPPLVALMSENNRPERRILISDLWIFIMCNARGSERKESEEQDADWEASGRGGICE